MITTIDQRGSHIGNKEIQNWPRNEGQRWERDFTLNQVYRANVLALDVYHTQANNQVWINGRMIGSLFQSPVWHWVPCSLLVPHDCLRVGTNRLTIQAGALPSGDADDFQIQNVRLIQSDPQALSWRAPKTRGPTFVGLSIEALQSIRLNKNGDRPAKQLTIESKSVGTITYQLKKIYCSNPRYKSCPHDPYWYAYYRESSRVISKYIGKD